MKNRVLALLLCLTCSVLSAQVREKGTIEITPNLGYTSSTLVGDDTEDLEFRNSFQAGVLVDIYFNDRWSLRTGGSFMSMGAREFGSEIVLDYLNIPVNANWHFGSTRKWNLNFGLSPGFLATADIEGVDVGDFLKSFQLAITYGIGYKIEVSENFSILIDAQGVAGISNIVKEAEDGRNANAGSSLNVGAVFKL